MKTILCLFSAFCVMVFCFDSAKAAPNATDEFSSRLAIELRDGSRVVGRSMDDDLKFHSAALGDMKLSWAVIHSIEFTADTDIARLTATNGDAFTVQIAADTLNIETGFGKTELAVKVIRSIKALPVAQPTVPAITDTTGDLGSRLTVELRDGSHIVGNGLDGNMNFRSSAMGDIKLAWTGIRSVEFASTNLDMARLTVTNGDVYEVQFWESSIHIETSFGKTELPVKLIRSLKVSPIYKFGGMPSGLVALWSGEGDANDSVGGCNGQLVNGVQFVPGKVGQAFSLNEGSMSGGSSSGFFSAGFSRGAGFLLIPSGPSLNVGIGEGLAFTAWIKPTTVSREMLIAEYEKVLGTADGSDVGVDFAIQRVNGAGGWCLYANLTDTYDDKSHMLVSPPNMLSAGSWQHVAFTYDRNSGSATLYLNGAVVAKENFGNIVPQTSFPYLIIGGKTTYGSVLNPKSVFSGEMDELSLYNRALSASEIQAICTEQNNGEPLPPPPTSSANY